MRPCTILGDTGIIVLYLTKLSKVTQEEVWWHLVVSLLIDQKAEKSSEAYNSNLIGLRWCSYTVLSVYFQKQWIHSLTFILYFKILFFVFLNFNSIHGSSEGEGWCWGRSLFPTPHFGLSASVKSQIFEEKYCQYLS